MAYFEFRTLIYLLVLTYPLLVDCKKTPSFGCSRAAAKRLYPCGNAAVYEQIMKKDASMFLKFTRIGDSCFAMSSEQGNKEKTTWYQANSTCASNYSQLAVLNNDALQKLKGQLDTNTYYWVGGKWDSERKHFSWINGDKITTNWVEAGPSNTHGDGHCVATKSALLYGRPCNISYDWICQQHKNDYYTQNVLGIVPEDDGTHYYVDSIAMDILCASRSIRGIETSIRLRDGDTFSIDSNRRESPEGHKLSLIIMDLYVKETSYVLIGMRCFGFFGMSLRIRLSPKLHGSTISCCAKGSGTKCKSKQIFIDYGQKQPAVFLHFQKRAREEANNTEWMATYMCVTTPGTETKMTLAIVQGGVYWGRVYSTGGLTKDAGIPPQWFNAVQLTFVPFLPHKFSSMFLLLTFNTSADMDKATIYCSSEDILDKVVDATIKDVTNFTEQHDLNIIDPLRSPRLQFLRFPSPAMDGLIHLYACDVMEMSCKGRTGSGGNLRLLIKTQLSRYGWYLTNRQHIRLPQWLTVKNVAESWHPTYGLAMEVNMMLEVTAEIIDAAFKCIATKEDKNRETRYDFPFQVSIGSLPPNMTSYIYGVDEPIYYLELKCSSQVGPGNVQTWTLLDHKGRKFFWFLQQTGDIQESKNMSWIEIGILSSDYDKQCGVTLVSTLKVRKRSVKQGATLTCYSYNTSATFSSRFSMEELQASYDIFGGGNDPKDDDDAVEDIRWVWVWVTVLPFVSGSVTVIWIIWRHRRHCNFIPGCGRRISWNSTKSGKGRKDTLNTLDEFDDEDLDDDDDDDDDRDSAISGRTSLSTTVDITSKPPGGGVTGEKLVSNGQKLDPKKSSAVSSL